jgi:hypothetical protein
MNHQEIADRLDALITETSEAYKRDLARIAKERESLVEMCGSLGHVYKHSRDLIFAGGKGGKLSCCICGANQP